jgi:hypothetical protein
LKGCNGVGTVEEGGETAHSRRGLQYLIEEMSKKIL